MFFGGNPIGLSLFYVNLVNKNTIFIFDLVNRNIIFDKKVVDSNIIPIFAAKFKTP